AKPVGGQLSGSQSVCVGNGGTLKLTDYSGKILSWESSTDQITWTGISHTLEEYAFLPIRKKTFFRVNVASLGQAAGCSSVVKSEIFVVDVDPETKGGTTSGAATYCVTSKSGKIDLTGHTGNVVRWESSTDDGHTWNLIQSTATSYSYSKLKFTTQFRAIVKSGSCSEASSSVTSVQILPLPTEPYAGENEILCEGTTTFTLKGNRPEV